MGREPSYPDPLRDSTHVRLWRKKTDSFTYLSQVLIRKSMGLFTYFDSQIRGERANRLSKRATRTKAVSIKWVDRAQSCLPAGRLAHPIRTILTIHTSPSGRSLNHPAYRQAGYLRICESNRGNHQPQTSSLRVRHRSL